MGSCFSSSHRSRETPARVVKMEARERKKSTKSKAQPYVSGKKLQPTVGIQSVTKDAESTQIAAPERNQHTHAPLPLISAPTPLSLALQQQVATGDANPTAEHLESTQAVGPESIQPIHAKAQQHIVTAARSPRKVQSVRNLQGVPVEPNSEFAEPEQSRPIDVPSAAPVLSPEPDVQLSVILEEIDSTPKFSTPTDTENSQTVQITIPTDIPLQSTRHETILQTELLEPTTTEPNRAVSFQAARIHPTEEELRNSNPGPEEMNELSTARPRPILVAPNQPRPTASAAIPRSTAENYLHTVTSIELEADMIKTANAIEKNELKSAEVSNARCDCDNERRSWTQFLRALQGLLQSHPLRDEDGADEYIRLGKAAAIPLIAILNKKSWELARELQQLDEHRTALIAELVRISSQLRAQKTNELARLKHNAEVVFEERKRIDRELVRRAKQYRELDELGKASRHVVMVVGALDGRWRPLAVDKVEILARIRWLAEESTEAGEYIRHNVKYGVELFKGLTDIGKKLDEYE